MFVRDRYLAKLICQSEGSERSICRMTVGVLLKSLSHLLKLWHNCNNRHLSVWQNCEICTLDSSGRTVENGFDITVSPRELTFSSWGCCVNVTDINQPSLPTSFYSVLVSVSVFMALSTLFYFIHSPANSSLSHSVLLVLVLPYLSFQLYISLSKSPSTLI